MTLIIDSREPRHLIERLLAAVPGSRVETLPYGDYILEGSRQRFIIERKNIRDLFHSLKDGRMWEQMKGIERFEGYKRVVLIEGGFWSAHNWDKTITLARFTGTKVSLLYGWENMSWVQTENQDETVDFLVRLSTKVGNAEEETYTRSVGFAKINRTELEEVVDGLKWIDGIGEAKAKELLVRFKTLGHIPRATVKELTNVLGEKDAKHVFEVYQRKYSEKKAKKEKDGEVSETSSDEGEQ